MVNNHFLRFWIMFSLFLLLMTAKVNAQVQKVDNYKNPGLVQYLPGFFTWNENTVMQLENGTESQIWHFQHILDHTNTDFTDSPESVILLIIDPAGKDSQVSHPYTIEVSEDSLQVFARSESDMERALLQVKRMKLEAEKNSPDYGLIYLRCGLYRRENF